MILTRKTLKPWVLQVMGAAEPTLVIRHAALASGYTAESPSGRISIMAVGKRKKVSDFTRAAGREETGVNASIWEAMEKAKKPVRLAVVHQGHVWLHNSPDMRSTNPHIRMVGGQARFDVKGVAWWAFSDFIDCTKGLPKPEPEPEPEDDGNDILDFFGK